MRVKFNVNDKNFKVGDIVYCYNRPTTWATHTKGGYFARMSNKTPYSSLYYDVCIDKGSLLSQYGYWPSEGDIIVKVDYINYYEGDIVNFDGHVFRVLSKPTRDTINIKSLDDDTETVVFYTDVLPLPNTYYKNKLKKELNLKV